MSPANLNADDSIGLDLSSSPAMRFGYNINTSSMATFLNAARNTRLNTADTLILCCGDSTTYGAQGVGQDPSTKSYPSFMRSSIANYLTPALSVENGLSIPPGVITGDLDPRWSAGVGWSLTAWGFGTKAGYQRSTATSELTYTPYTLCDTFDVYYVINAGFGTMQAQVDSETPVTLSAAGGASVGKWTVSAALHSSAHVLRLTGSGGDMFILGVTARSSSSKKVLVGNAGISSTTSTNWAGNSLPFASIGTIGLYAPHLTLLMVGINDAISSVTKASFKSNVSAVAVAAAVSGSVILMPPVPSNPALVDTDLEYQYRAALLELCDSGGYGFFDTWSLFKGYWSYASAAGLMFDGKHPLLAGYRLISDTLARVFSELNL